MLCEIELCYNYCLKYKRILVLDSSTNWFKEDIRDYIEFDSPVFYKGPLDILYSKLNNKTTYPEFLKRNLKNFKFNNIFTNMNLNCNYEETVCIYLKGGGGILSIDLLNRCMFKSIIVNVFRERFNKLPKNYISVHIRNTDKISNVDTFLQSYKNELIGQPMFLGTDHAPTILKFKEIFGEHIYCFSKIPDNNGKNIHENHSLIPTREFNIDCFVDLLLLASGSKLYISNVINHYQSGYGTLAMNLHKNKELLARLTA